MKTQNVNNKLRFDKSSITELNDNQLNNIEGGTTTVICSIAVTVVVYSLVKQAIDNHK